LYVCNESTYELGELSSTGRIRLQQWLSPFTKQDLYRLKFNSPISWDNLEMSMIQGSGTLEVIKP
jgi:hypothetical protein